jgi:hypothetical protein
MHGDAMRCDAMMCDGTVRHRALLCCYITHHPPRLV